MGAALGALRLDGLTVVRTVKTPTIRIALPGLGMVTVRNSTSELVFKTLHLKELNVVGTDMGTSPLNVTALADVDMAGLMTVKVDIDMNGSLIPGSKARRWRTSSSSRFQTRIVGINPHLGFQLGLLK